MCRSDSLNNIFNTINNIHPNVPSVYHKTEQNTVAKPNQVRQTANIHATPNHFCVSTVKHEVHHLDNNFIYIDLCEPCLEANPKSIPRSV